LNSFKLLEHLEVTFFNHTSSIKADDQGPPHYVRNSSSSAILRLTVKLKARQSYPTAGLDRSLGLQEVEVSRITSQSVHEDGMVVNPTHRPPLPAGDTSGTHCRKEAETTPWP
jgi:hypothetical protein